MSNPNARRATFGALWYMYVTITSLSLAFYVMEGWIKQAYDIAFCFVKILVVSDC